MEENHLNALGELKQQIVLLEQDLSERETRIDQMNEEYAILKEDQENMLEEAKYLRHSLDNQSLKVSCFFVIF